jgi:hypothetical protein
VHRRNDDARVLDGGWSREKLIAMDRRFEAAMERALMAQKAVNHNINNGLAGAGRTRADGHPAVGRERIRQ